MSRWHVYQRQLPIKPNGKHNTHGEPKMQTKIVNFTPTLAMELLANNGKNRHVSQRMIDKYAADMMTGNWKADNGESLKFADSGTLLDGQHRLHAIVQSGVSMKLLVVSGLNEDAFMTIDSGKSRTAGDLVSIAGIGNANAMAAAAKNVLTLRHGKGPIIRADLRPTRQQILDFVRENELSLHNSVKLVRGKGDGIVMGNSMAAALHFLFSNTSILPDSAEKADAFFYQLRTGDYDGSLPIKRHPVYLLRERVLTARSARQTVNKHILVALAIKAWNAYATDTELGTLRIVSAESFPEIM